MIEGRTSIRSYLLWNMPMIVSYLTKNIPSILWIFSIAIVLSTFHRILKVSHNISEWFAYKKEPKKKVKYWFTKHDKYLSTHVQKFCSKKSKLIIDSWETCEDKKQLLRKVTFLMDLQNGQTKKRFSNLLNVWFCFYSMYLWLLQSPRLRHSKAIVLSCFCKYLHKVTWRRIESRRPCKYFSSFKLFWLTEWRAFNFAGIQEWLLGDKMDV